MRATISSEESQIKYETYFMQITFLFMSRDMKSYWFFLLPRLTKISRAYRSHLANALFSYLLNSCINK